MISAPIHITKTLPTESENLPLKGLENKAIMAKDGIISHLYCVPPISSSKTGKSGNTIVKLLKNSKQARHSFQKEIG